MHTLQWYTQYCTHRDHPLIKQQCQHFSWITFSIFHFPIAYLPFSCSENRPHLDSYVMFPLSVYVFDVICRICSLSIGKANKPTLYTMCITLLFLLYSLLRTRWIWFALICEQIFFWHIDRMREKQTQINDLCKHWKMQCSWTTWTWLVIFNVLYFEYELTSTHQLRSDISVNRKYENQPHK